MIKKLYEILLSQYRKFFKSEESKFYLLICFKITIIPMLLLFFTLFILGFFIKINFLLFESHMQEKWPDLRNTYYEYVFNGVEKFVPFVLVFFIVIFFAGLFYAKFMLLPFKKIGVLSESFINNKPIQLGKRFWGKNYLLNEFGDFFFEWLKSCEDAGKLSINTIPANFRGIHSPIYDRSFFFNFFLLMGTFFVIYEVGLFIITMDVYEQIVELGLKIIEPNKAINHFLIEEKNIFYEIIWWAFGISVPLYIWLGFHLFGFVKVGVFGIFATMRTFMKGNSSSRVHLIGFNYIRSYYRPFNKCLDYVNNKYYSQVK